MRGILIDPWFKAIREVEVDQGIDAMYKIMSHPLGPKVDIFTMGMNWPNGDVLYVDDEGFLKPGGRLFLIDRLDRQPLVGCGLILGSDAEGNSVDAKSMLVEIETKVSWTNKVTR